MCSSPNQPGRLGIYQTLRRHGPSRGRPQKISRVEVREMPETNVEPQLNHTGAASQLKFAASAQSRTAEAVPSIVGSFVE
jgi:hypothetical protein